ncbi:MAG: hypothetical protein AB1412_01915 [Pseudomonadota bacterium]
MQQRFGDEGQRGHRQAGNRLGKANSVNSSAFFSSPLCRADDEKTNQAASSPSIGCEDRNNKTRASKPPAIA